MMLKDMFVGADKPKIPKQKPPPSTSSTQIQAAENDARRRAMLAQGRSSTVIGGSNLGNVG